MNLPSKLREGGVAESSVRFLNGTAQGKSVSRLEFHAVDSLAAETHDAAEGLWIDAEARLLEEVAALKVKLVEQLEECSRQIEEARRDARLVARGEWELELEEKVASERGSMLKALEHLGREKTRYFAGIEAEVVKLALAIAQRVLHREVQLDPLLLQATARIALEKIAEDSVAVLRVPEADVAAWRDVLEGVAESARLVGDEHMRTGECVLETNIGRVELGVSAQLAEIEKGFFDLLQMRPA
jgi:flagellar assembly protein FliH